MSGEWVSRKYWSCMQCAAQCSSQSITSWMYPGCILEEEEDEGEEGSARQDKT